MSGSCRTWCLPYWNRNWVLLVGLSNDEYCYSVVSSDPNETGVIDIDP